MALERPRFVPARYFTSVSGRRDIRLEVLHDMEAPEKPTTAEAVAAWWHGPTSPKTSAHYVYDNDSELQCVQDNDVAYAAPGANHDGRHYELAGYAHQTVNEWKDPFSLATIARCARRVSENCELSGNAKTWLSDGEIRAGKRGICDHAAISRVYKKSTHYDCGPNFPKDLFVDLVRAAPLLNATPTPTGQVTIMQNAISGRRCPVDGGLQKLQADGGIFNSDGCGHFFGSWFSDGSNNEPDMRPHHAPGRDPVALLDSYIGPEHYAILMRDGTVFDF